MRTTSAPGKAHVSCMIRPRNETDRAAWSRTVTARPAARRSPRFSMALNTGSKVYMGAAIKMPVALARD